MKQSDKLSQPQPFFCDVQPGGYLCSITNGVIRLKQVKR